MYLTQFFSLNQEMEFRESRMNCLFKEKRMNLRSKSRQMDKSDKSVAKATVF